MKSMMCAVLLGMTMLVAACAPRPTAEEIGVRDDAVCRGHGLVAGAPEYDQCRQRLANARSAYETYRLVLDAGVLQSQSR